MFRMSVTLFVLATQATISTEDLHMIGVSATHSKTNTNDPFVGMNDCQNWKENINIKTGDFLFIVLKLSG